MLLWSRPVLIALSETIRLHDNSKGELAAENGGNNSLIMGYVVTNLLIENNSLYNAYGHGITLKDDVDGVTIRYNWFYNNALGGIITGNNAADDYEVSGSIYQNIFATQGTKAGNLDDMGGFIDSIETSLMYVYNNVFDYGGYGTRAGDLGSRSGGVPIHWFNNIHHRSRSAYVNVPYAGSVFPSLYHDYNAYYGGAVGWIKYLNTYTNLTEWKDATVCAAINCDEHSVITDPGFLNASGNFNTPSDFKRASYTPNGRGGSYPSVMGAYITGNETIGYTNPAGRKYRVRISTGD